YSLIYGTLIIIGYFIFRIVLFILPGRYNKKFITFTKILWLELTIAYGSLFFPHTVHLAVDQKILEKLNSKSFIQNILSKENKFRDFNTLVISNHLTNYDWLFMLVILHKLNLYENITIILKYSLSKIPIFGTAMRYFGYVFVKRDWEYDRNIIIRMLGSDDQKSLLLFPEGTIHTKYEHEKTIEYVRNAKITFSRDFDIGPSVDNKTLDIKTSVDNEALDGHKEGHTESHRTSEDHEALDSKTSIDKTIEDNEALNSKTLYGHRTSEDHEALDDGHKEGHTESHTENHKILDRKTSVDKTTKDNEALDDKNLKSFPYYTLLPRQKGFSLVLNHLKPHFIIDTTLFFIPFNLYPQNQHGYKSVYYENIGQISYFAILDVYETTFSLKNEISKENTNLENISKENKNSENDISKENGTFQDHSENNTILKDSVILKDYTDLKNHVNLSTDTHTKNFLYNLFYEKDKKLALYDQNSKLFSLTTTGKEFQKNFSMVFKNQKYSFIEVRFIRKRNLWFLVLYILVMYILKRMCF
ncbi:Lysophosphatidic acid acyltransferase LPAAT, partial [Pseudoloma neurophilia]